MTNVLPTVFLKVVVKMGLVWILQGLHGQVVFGEQWCYGGMGASGLQMNWKSSVTQSGEEGANFPMTEFTVFLWGADLCALETPTLCN